MAVLAAVLASEKDTDDGFLWKLEAVLRAACFCAHVVPSPDGFAGGFAGGLGEEGDDGDDDVRNLEKRFWSSLSCDEDVPVGRGGWGGPCEPVSSLEELDRPMPNPGTDTPAAPNLLTAP